MMSLISQMPLDDKETLIVAKSQKQVSRFFRDCAREEFTDVASFLLEHSFLPVQEIKLRPGSPASAWPSSVGLGDAHEAYIETLRLFQDAARKAAGVPQGIVASALAAVVDAANKLASLGWMVNWQQNVRWCLLDSDLGLSGFSVVKRYDDLPELVGLTERLETLSGVTFFLQSKKAGNKLSSPKPEFLTENGERVYGDIKLHRQSQTGRRYASEWFADPMSNKTIRLLSD